MSIEQFKHNGETIRCTNCGHDFEVSRHELADPERLTAKKERIAAKHTCGKRRQHMFPLEDTRPRAINRYFDRRVRRYLTA